MSKTILSLFTNGHHIIMFEMERPISILPFSAKLAIMMIECTIFLFFMIDTRVPLHSFKFVAALQHSAGKTNNAPLLLRHHLKTGHGAGKPTKKVIQEASERFAFMMTATGTKFLPKRKIYRL